MVWNQLKPVTIYRALSNCVYKLRSFLMRKKWMIKTKAYLHFQLVSAFHEGTVKGVKGVPSIYQQPLENIQHSSFCVMFTNETSDY